MLAMCSITFLLSIYFTFAAVQGDYGVFRRSEISSEAVKFEKELAQLEKEVEIMENLTKRMSDDFLDLDLLDQQVRTVLGYIRKNEIVINLATE